MNLASHTATEPIASDALRREAKIVGSYLLGQMPNDTCLKLYENAIAKLEANRDAKIASILNFILRHPRSVPFVDAALAVIDRDSAIRRRMFIMFAILEASPEYCDYFLPIKRSRLYGLFVLWTAARAALKAALGIVILKLI